MKKLDIVWKHFDKEGNTCQRCSTTGDSLIKAIEELGKEGIKITFKEIKLARDEIPVSNSILFNGINLEDLLENTKSIQTPCKSCCELIGSSVKCRALECNGQTKEDISVELIKTAVKNLLRKEEQ